MRDIKLIGIINEKDC